MLKLFVASMMIVSLSAVAAPKKAVTYQTLSVDQVKSVLVQTGKYEGGYALTTVPAAWSKPASPMTMSFAQGSDGYIEYVAKRKSGQFPEPLDDGTCGSQVEKRYLYLETADGSQNSKGFKGHIKALSCHKKQVSTDYKTIPVIELKVTEDGVLEMKAVVGKYNDQYEPDPNGAYTMVGIYQMVPN